MHKKKDKLFKKQQASKRSKDIGSYKSMKARGQTGERQAYLNYLDKILYFGDPDTEDQSGKMQRFWSFVKSLRTDNRGIAPHKVQGKVHADPVGKSDILTRQYESVYTKEDEDAGFLVIQG